MNTLKNVETKISLIKPVLIFYLLVASNFTKYLYSYQLDNFFKTNRYAQHILGFIMMLVIFIEFGNKKNTPNKIVNILKYSSLAYLWFIFTTKMDLHWNLAILGLLAVGFIYEHWMDSKVGMSKKDPSLEKSNIKKIKNEHKNIKKIMLFTIIAITIIGTVQYLLKKRNQFDDGFDELQYIFAASKRFNLDDQ